jgi:hypothetical protein
MSSRRRRRAGAQSTEERRAKRAKRAAVVDDAPPPRERLAQPPVLGVRPTLAEHGCVVLDVIPPAEMAAVEREFAESIRSGLGDVPPTYTFTDRHGEKTRHTQLVGGGFGALAHFGSAFGAVPDALRRRSHEALLAYLRAHPRCFGFDHSGSELECLPDRALERQVGESYGGGSPAAMRKSIHRDRCPTKVPAGTVVLGGWLVVSQKQAFTFEPGSAEDEVTGSFDKLTEAEQLASYRRMVTVEILPGQAVFFRQTLAHAVRGAVAAHVVRRLFLGACVSPAGGPLLYQRMGEDLADYFRRGLMPPVKSGEPCAVFPRNWYGFNTPRLRAWARAVFGVDDVEEWVKGSLGGFGQRVLPALADRGIPVPAVDADLFLHKEPLCNI